MYKRKNSKTKLYVALIVLVLCLSGYLTITGWRNAQTNRQGRSQPTVASLVDIPILNKKVSQPLPLYKQPDMGAVLPQAKWVPQTFNNCGPATTSMVLQYFGYTVSQVETKKDLRTNESDSNVFTYEIRDYLKNTYDIEGKLLYNGSIQRLKALLANGIYLVIEDWLHPYEDIGHNMIIRGFDDNEGVFIADDPYFGVGIKYKYDIFEQGQWKPFNREYMPVYQKDLEPLVMAIVGNDWDEKTMYQRAVEVAKAELEKNKDDMYAWFNLGTSYYGLGDYRNAKSAFERSQAIGWPKRMLWYQIQPVQTYNKLGEYQKASELAKIGLSTYEPFAELHLESAIAYKGMGNLEKAKEEIDRALILAPNYQPLINFSNEL